MSDFNTYDYTENYNLPYPNNNEEEVDLIENLQKLAEATDTALEGKADTSDIPDLTHYVLDTDYATSSKGGVIKTMANYNTECDSQGRIRAITNSYVQYDALGNNAFIGKGTLENVITGKNLEVTSNKVTSLSSSSTDTQYPSAKCVYDIIGDIESALQTLNTGGGVE